MKLPKNRNQKKARNPFIYAGLQAYLPWNILYLRPLPHGKKLKHPGNFFLSNWYFLFKTNNFLLNNCKFLFNNVSNSVSKRIDLIILLNLDFHL